MKRQFVPGLIQGYYASYNKGSGLNYGVDLYIDGFGLGGGYYSGRGAGEGNTVGNGTGSGHARFPFLPRAEP